MRDINEGKDICTLLDMKLTHFKQYLSITEKMQQAFGNKEETNNLDKLISKRQGCADNIERIDLSIARILKKGSRELSRISSKYKGIIDGCLLKIRNIMTTVDLMDKEIMVMVKQEVEVAKTEVLKTQKFRQAAKGYSGKARFTARFLDTRR
jgi:hypothetical protein